MGGAVPPDDRWEVVNKGRIKYAYYLQWGLSREFARNEAQMPCHRSRASQSRWRTSLRWVLGRESPRGGGVRRVGRRRSSGFRRGRPRMARRRVELASRWVRVRERPASRSELYPPSPPQWGWQKNRPSDDQKVLNVQRLPHGWRQLSVQKVTN